MLSARVIVVKRRPALPMVERAAAVADQPPRERDLKLETICGRIA